MSVGGYDFEINGVKYNAAEDAEGNHYSLSGEPLRPPNSVVVQGEGNNQLFQMRPDTLLWSLTDWSGGEGQTKFNPQAPNMWRKLNAVNPFTQPGTLRPGPYLVDTLDSTGLADFAETVILVIAQETLYAFSGTTNAYYEWDSGTEQWGAAVTITGPSGGATTVCTDGKSIFFTEGGAGDVWSLSPGGTVATSLSTTLIDANPEHICEQGNNVYVGPDPAVSGSQGIYEVAKSGSTPVLIDSFSLFIKDYALVAMDGKVYAMGSDDTHTEIREIVPSSAAGTGFGNQIAVLPGFDADDMWSHSGILFLVGRFGAGGDSALMYLQPSDGTYGTLGRVRARELLDEVAGPARSNRTNSRLLEHFWASSQRNATDAKVSLWMVDAVSGGLTNLGYAADTDGTEGAYSLALFGEDVFINTVGTKRLIRAKDGTYSKSAQAISPWHDFGLAEEKILASLVLSMEELPADWTVYVDYAVDGSDTWTTHITQDTDDSVGERSQVSNDTTTVKFRSLSVRVRMEYGGAGVPTSAPVIQGVDVLATVAKLNSVYRILLDLSDDKSGPYSGYRKRTNITTAAAQETVIDFKDGYGSRDPGTYDTLDVIIDSYQIISSQPGEGVAEVVLRKVF